MRTPPCQGRRQLPLPFTADRPISLRHRHSMLPLIYFWMAPQSSPCLLAILPLVPEVKVQVKFTLVIWLRKAYPYLRLLHMTIEGLWSNHSTCSFDYLTSPSGSPVQAHPIRFLAGQCVSSRISAQYDAVDPLVSWRLNLLQKYKLNLPFLDLASETIALSAPASHERLHTLHQRGIACLDSASLSHRSRCRQAYEHEPNSGPWCNTPL